MFDLARELGSGNWQLEALQGLGRVHHAAGRLDLALTHALELLIGHGVDHTDDIEASVAKIEAHLRPPDA